LEAAGVGRHDAARLLPLLAAVAATAVVAASGTLLQLCLTATAMYGLWFHEVHNLCHFAVPSLGSACDEALLKWALALLGGVWPYEVFQLEHALHHV